VFDDGIVQRTASFEVHAIGIASRRISFIDTKILHFLEEGKIRYVAWGDVVVIDRYCSHVLRFRDVRRRGSNTQWQVLSCWV
jgi:hypothetical protein